MIYNLGVRSLKSAVKMCLIVLLSCSLAYAQGPGRGKTAPLEIEYLKFIIDHHYSALRMTELAAGTDATRDTALSPIEGTSPTPQFSPTLAKAQLDAVKSMARQANRMQREEILKAQNFLREWYNVSHQPQLSQDGQNMISMLTRTASGSEFDKAFLKVFSRHHYTALKPTIDCLTGADVAHIDLERYCRNIVEAQTSEIDEMRHMLCEKFSECDVQPFISARRRHWVDMAVNLD